MHLEIAGFETDAGGPKRCQRWHAERAPIACSARRRNRNHPRRRLAPSDADLAFTECRSLSRCCSRIDTTGSKGRPASDPSASSGRTCSRCSSAPPAVHSGRGRVRIGRGVLRWRGGPQPGHLVGWGWAWRGQLRRGLGYRTRAPLDLHTRSARDQIAAGAVRKRDPALSTDQLCVTPFVGLWVATSPVVFNVVFVLWKGWSWLLSLSCSTPVGERCRDVSS